MSAPHPWPPLPLAPSTAEEALAVALGRWPSLALASSLGPTSIVVLHLLERLGARVPVVLVDTGLLFDQTLALKERVEQRFGLELQVERAPSSVAQQEAAHGPALWDRAPELCCELRKLGPLRKALRGRPAWITGLRRDQGAMQCGLETIAWDQAHGVVQVSPLAHWSRGEVFTWLKRHRLPYNALLDTGQQALGCRPCARLARCSSAGEDPRRRPALPQALAGW